MRKKKNNEEVEEKFNSDNPDLVKLKQLNKLLSVQSFYYNFDKEIQLANEKLKKTYVAYTKLKTTRRFEAFFRATIERQKLKLKYFSIDIDKIQEKLQEFEGFLNKKYWDEDIIFHFSIYLMCGIAKTLNEAIEMYERMYKQI